jgi:hypothetical protein
VRGQTDLSRQSYQLLSLDRAEGTNVVYLEQWTLSAVRWESPWLLVLRSSLVHRLVLLVCNSVLK